MNSGSLFKHVFVTLFLTFYCLPCCVTQAMAAEGVEYSYHGQMGLGTGLGMLEKWCALPNFSFSEQGGIDGWSAQSCNGCHIGAYWNPSKPAADCKACHASADPVAGDQPTVAKCMGCHKKDTAKRGDLFTAEQDVHIAAGMICQDCHLKVSDGMSDHQFLKGTAMDTTESTMEGTMSCTTACHSEQPHIAGTRNGPVLDKHVAKVACETCHTGLRPAAALESRKWNVFTEAGKPVTTMRTERWLPEYKWYDNTGPGASGDYHLPILFHTERRDIPGARIYPFNPVTVDWYVQTADSAMDDVIIVPAVKAADLDGDRTVTLEEMRASYPEATLVTADMNFSISHSVVPKNLAFSCGDCHGRNGWVLDWNELGYEKDPRGTPQRIGKKQHGRKKK